MAFDAMVQTLPDRNAASVSAATAQAWGVKKSNGDPMYADDYFLAPLKPQRKRQSVEDQIRAVKRRGRK